MDFSGIVILCLFLISASSTTESKCSEYVLILEKRLNELHPVIITKIDWNESPQPYNATSKIHDKYRSKETASLGCFKSNTICASTTSTSTTTLTTTTTAPTSTALTTSNTPGTATTTTTTSTSTGKTTTTLSIISTTPTTIEPELNSSTVRGKNDNENQKLKDNLGIGSGVVPEEKWIDTTKLAATAVGIAAAGVGLTIYVMKRCARQKGQVRITNDNAEIAEAPV